VLITADEAAQLDERLLDDPCLAVIHKPYTFAHLKESLTQLGVRCQRSH
jgi:hypothetical protein